MRKIALILFLWALQSCETKDYKYELKIKDCPTAQWRTIFVNVTVLEDCSSDPFIIETEKQAVPLLKQRGSGIIAYNVCDYVILSKKDRSILKPVN